MEQNIDFERERKQLTRKAWAATIAYVVVLLVLASFALFGKKGIDTFRGMSPNEVGDLLAGIAAPLALIWLICGYYMQGLSMRQHAKEIAGNTEVIKMQIAEMEARRKHRASEIAPKFILRMSGSSHGSNSQFIAEIEITNKGERARHLRLLFQESGYVPDPREIYEICKNSSATINLRFDENHKGFVPFSIRCLDEDGDSRDMKFKMEIQRVHSDSITGIAFLPESDLI